MGKKLDPDTMSKLIEEFNNIVVPWCKKNKLGLHKALIESQKDPEIERILHTLYKSSNGYYYVYTIFKENNYFGEKRY